MIPLTIAQFLLIVAVIVYLTTNMVHLVRLDPVTTPPEGKTPMVTICVPARNEERDVRACLESLLKQDYPNFEVIAVDDNSRDETPQIMAELAEQYPNLIVIEGGPLPPLWLGKPYALYQAYRQSRGEYLLFTDADPVFEPHALTTAMHTMQERELDMLTLMPRAEFGSFWERAVQPVIFGFIAAMTRFEKVNDPDSSSGMGFGVFLMFKKPAYQLIGGHMGVRQEVLEDIALAKAAKRSGLKLLVADAKPLLSIRMYHSLREIWEGWRKNMFLAMKASIGRTFYYMFMILGFVLTPYLVVLANLILWQGWIWLLVSLAGLGMVIFAGLTLCHELRLEKQNVWLFPLGAVVMAGIMLNSMTHVIVFGQTEWRGRVYET